MTHFVSYYFVPFSCPRGSLSITPIFAITIPGGSAGKESVCNAGDPGSIHGSGRYTGEGIDTLEKIHWRRDILEAQYPWASLATQTVKNLPAMWDIWIQSLGWEDSLEQGTATRSSVLAWRIPMDNRARWVRHAS